MSMGQVVVLKRMAQDRDHLQPKALQVRQCGQHAAVWLAMPEAVQSVLAHGMSGGLYTCQMYLYMHQ